MPLAPIPNPERTWEARPGTTAADLDEVVRRIGRVDTPLVVLPGGLANTNILLGDKVLRIHRREPAPHASRRRCWRARGRRSECRRCSRPATTSCFSSTCRTGPCSGASSTGPPSAERSRRSTPSPSPRLVTSGLIARLPYPFADLVTSLLDYARSQLAHQGSGLPDHMAARIMEALDAHATAMRTVAGPPVLLHGDFKPSNLHWADDGRLLVLDWEFAYSGLVANLRGTDSSQRARDVSTRVDATLALLG